MGKKITDYIITQIGKLLDRIIIIHRGYDENLVTKGFKSMRYYSFDTKIVILGSDREENRKVIETTKIRLMKGCVARVKADIRQTKKKLKSLSDEDEE